MQDLLLEAEITQDNEPQFIEELVKERLTYDKDGKCTNAFSIISDTEFLKQAYLTIKSNPGNMVPGTDKETLDGISSN
jgi:preprotein translocase subunit Sec63